jgi:hypothetical protein
MEEEEEEEEERRRGGEEEEKKRSLIKDLKRALGVFGGTRTLCFRYPRAAQARPQAQARPTTPSNGARVQA